MTRFVSFRRALRAAALAAFVFAAGCSATRSTEEPAPPAAAAPPLREAAAARGMYVGAAVASAFPTLDATDPAYRPALGRHFNMLVTENALKFGPLRPAPGVFNFATPDAIVAFAEEHGMKVRGHTFVWHTQMPAWLVEGGYSAEQVRAYLQEHIRTVAGRYKGRIYAWDVVNEAVEEDGSARRTFWLEKLGRGYLEEAFRAAHEADPQALLFYNDYGTEGIGPKSDSVYALLADLKRRGVPVHGVGFQCHFEAGRAPKQADMEANFKRFAALGLKVHLTEVDVRVRVPQTSAGLKMQTDTYADLTRACLATPACEAIVMWGLTDRYSWVPGFFQGYDNGLLLDRAYAAKPAYRAMYDLLKGS